jgi:hypothetical protein
MKEHFCPVEQSVITYQDKCNWCGESEGSMNEIIEMVRKAGIKNDCDGIWCTADQLETFYNLAIAKEREDLSKALEDASKTGRIVNLTFVLKAIRARGQA